MQRIDVVGYLTVEAEGDAFRAGATPTSRGNVRCGIPRFDHPGNELHGEALRSADPALRWQVIGWCHATFTTDFDYHSGPNVAVRQVPQLFNSPVPGEQPRSGPAPC